MNPWFECWVEEFQPLITDMKDKGTAEKQVLQTKTGSNPPEIEQVSIQE